jgi:ribosomal protein S18 acetylase RimI-like enzyme
VKQLDGASQVDRNRRLPAYYSATVRKGCTGGERDGRAGKVAKVANMAKITTFLQMVRLGRRAASGAASGLFTPGAKSIRLLRMEIRELTARDAERYRTLRLFALEESPTAFGSSYAEEVERPVEVVARRFADANNHIFGAFTGDGRLVGMVTLRREPYAKMAHKATIFAMYVAPEVRQQGAGRALLAAAMARAVEVGVRQVNLTVTSTNEAAVGLYKSFGFERFGLERDASLIDGVFYDAAYMVVRVGEEG